MNNWIYNNEGDWFSINDFCHIWIEEVFHPDLPESFPRKFSIMGEWKHNAENVVIKNSFNSKKEAIAYINSALGFGWTVRNNQEKL